MSNSQEHDLPAIDPPLLDLSPDEIRQYDNPLPGWWKWLFAGTIAFSVVYVFIATITGGALSAVVAYDEDAAADAQRQFGTRVLAADAKSLFALTHDADMLKLGQGIFQTNCVVCHGANGEGVSCPNLTDDFYLDVKKLPDFVDVIAKGRKNGAMPAWETRLRPNEIIVVAAYAASLRGKNLPSIRGKEGELAPAFSDQ